MDRMSGSRLGLAAAILAGSLVSSTAQAARVDVSIAPPAPIVEARPVAPSHREIWIAGYHRWDGRAYVWVPGRWALPPRPGVAWVAPHWAHHSRGWYFVEGRWR